MGAVETGSKVLPNHTHAALAEEERGEGPAANFISVGAVETDSKELLIHTHAAAAPATTKHAASHAFGASNVGDSRFIVQSAAGDILYYVSEEVSKQNMSEGFGLHGL